MVAPSEAKEGIQFFLSGSRECESLFGYKHNGSWYANADGEDYPLEDPPTDVFEIGSISDYYDQNAEVVPTEYQVVQLSDGRFQVAFLSKPSKYTSGQTWHIDVFAEGRITPEKRLGVFVDPREQ